MIFEYDDQGMVSQETASSASGKDHAISAANSFDCDTSSSDVALPSPELPRESVKSSQSSDAIRMWMTAVHVLAKSR